MLFFSYSERINRSAAATSLSKRVRSSFGTIAGFSSCAAETIGIAVSAGATATVVSLSELAEADTFGVARSSGRGEISNGVDAGPTAASGALKSLRDVVFASLRRYN